MKQNNRTPLAYTTSKRQWCRPQTPQAIVFLLIAFLITTLFTGVAFATTATELALPAELKVIDKPSDNGGSILVTWNKMPYEKESVSYQFMIAEKKEGPYYPLDKIIYPYKSMADFPQSFGHDPKNSEHRAFEIKSFTIPAESAGGESKDSMISPNQVYYITMKVVEEGSAGEVLAQVEIPSTEALEITPVGNFFAHNKLNSFIILIILTIIILTFINLAQRHPEKLFVRRIAGLDAMDDALGRATEMGRSALFVHGLKSVSEVSTIAAINILGRIAKKIAEFDAGLKVANWDPIVQQVSQETVKEAYIEAGRPDTYKEENVFFAAGDQFSYAAAVEGIMVRERPATIFHFGYFYAESLLLTETGAHTGAIQIAGSDAFTQIPFFITTCDYTLIGEELYAASAYLSREPRLLGCLKGQDVGKMAIIIILTLGTIFTTFGWEKFAQIFWPA